MYFENKFIIDSEPINHTHYRKAIHKDKRTGPRINDVYVEQRESSYQKINFSAFECIGNYWSDYYIKELRKWKGLSPFFSASLIPKSILKGKNLKGEFVIERDSDYVVFGLIPNDKLKSFLLENKRLLFLESVVYTPLEKIVIV